jgi:hypothetical protein
MTIKLWEAENLDRFTMGVRPAAACKKFFRLEMVLSLPLRRFPRHAGPDADWLVAELKGGSAAAPGVGQPIAV